MIFVNRVNTEEERKHIIMPVIVKHKCANINCTIYKGKLPIEHNNPYYGKTFFCSKKCMLEWIKNIVAGEQNEI